MIRLTKDGVDYTTAKCYALRFIQLNARQIPKAHELALAYAKGVAKGMPKEQAKGFAHFSCNGSSHEDALVLASIYATAKGTGHSGEHALYYAEAMFHGCSDKERPVYSTARSKGWPPPKALIFARAYCLAKEEKFTHSESMIYARAIIRSLSPDDGKRIVHAFQRAKTDGCSEKDAHGFSNAFIDALSNGCIPAEAYFYALCMARGTLKAEAQAGLHHYKQLVMTGSSDVSASATAMSLVHATVQARLAEERAAAMASAVPMLATATSPPPMPSEPAP